MVCGEINRRGTSWGVLRPIEEGLHGVCSGPANRMFVTDENTRFLIIVGIE